MKQKTKSIKKIFFLALFFGIFALPAYGAPSINSVSSSVYEGANITISGNNLGNHPDYNGEMNFLNYRWKNFENGNIDGDGFIHSGEGYLEGKWELKETQNNNYARFFFNSVLDDERGALEVLQTDNPDLRFISFYFMVPENTQSGKFFRIWADSPANDIYLSTGCSDYFIRGASECSDCGSPQTQWSSPNQFVANEWHRIDILIQKYPSNFSVWMDNQLQFLKNNWVHPSFNGLGHTIDFGNMIDRPGDTIRCTPDGVTDICCSADGSYNYDRIYIDNTKARIEIGDNAIWANCTHREIQVPTNWSGDSATFTANQGSFQNGDTAYLFVVDENGEASAGYSITIGGESDATTPASPSGLSVG